MPLDQRIAGSHTRDIDQRRRLLGARRHRFQRFATTQPGTDWCRSRGEEKGEARMGLNRRIVVSEARCAVRINIGCDDHLAWIAKRWLKGEHQRDIARQLGYRNAGTISSALNAFIKRYYPEYVGTQNFGNDQVRRIWADDDNRKPLLQEALNRFARGGAKAASEAKDGPKSPVEPPWDLLTGSRN
jgi:hypothetical protein